MAEKRPRSRTGSTEDAAGDPAAEAARVDVPKGDPAGATRPTRPADDRHAASGIDAPVDPPVQLDAEAQLAAAERAAAEEAPALAARTRADSPTGHDGATPPLDAGGVDVAGRAFGRVSATDVTVSKGAVGLVRADRVSVELGALGGAIAGEVRVTQGVLNGVLAREAVIGQSLVRAIVAATVRVERPTGVLFLLARRVDGDVRAVFDWRAAAAFGAAFGAVVTVLRGRGR